MFVREPRLPTPPIPGGEIVIRAPVEVSRTVPVNLMTKLLPLTMGVAVVGMIALFVTSGAAVARHPTFMLFPVMMVVSTIGMLASGGRTGSRTAEIDEDRKQYLRYLAALREQASQTAHAQHVSLRWTHPNPDALWTLVGTRRMWERRSCDSDFGLVRVGLGMQPLATRIVVPEIGPTDDREPVTVAALHQFIEANSVVDDLPTTLPIAKLASVTIDGDIVPVRALVRAMICQLAVMHSPADVMIAAVAGPENARHWDWLKWLPHNQHPVAVDACGPGRMIFQRLRDAEASLPSQELPHVIVVFDAGIVTGDEQFFSDAGIDGVTVLDVGTRCNLAATHRGLRLRLQDLGVPDGLSVLQALTCARRLAPYHDPDARGAAAKSSWPTLMGIRDLQSTHTETPWRHRDGRRRLRVPIGTDAGGSPVELDLKEAAEGGMGPHGLCVGATGSGKSELLRTLTLGLIASHSPDLLNLVLVDFKGGATFAGFDQARHVAAVITNLADDAHLVSRMRDALAGEVNRRQELLRASGSFASVADYERARRAGSRLAPLPALLVVVDEFSELLSRNPEFADLFVALGRVGRSLGMHLLLASQRLDEGRLRGLESHLSYRICLKTFSAHESRAVIGIPDAFQLPGTPGRGYLRNGAAEPIAFQTAYVSGGYASRISRSVVKDPQRARVFTALPVGPVVRDLPAGQPPRRTVMEAVLDRINGQGTPAHSVWLPPLGDSPSLARLIGSAPLGAPLCVPIGLVDNPFAQRRDEYVVQLAGSEGNVAVVGAPQSGKSTALRTLVTALASTHTPDQVQFYCLDFGGGALAVLSSLPHVGSVASRMDRDLVRRTVAELGSLLRKREAAAAEQRNDNYGDVFLVIDGWATLHHEFEDLEAPITTLAAQGLSYGMHVVVTASRWAELRPALKDQLGTRIELRLGDPADSELDRKAAQLVPGNRPGRGITHDGKHMLIALPDGIADIGASVHRRFGERTAPAVRLLPACVEHRTDIAGVTVGVDEDELQPVVIDFTEQPHLLVLGDSGCGKTSALRLLCRELARTHSPAEAQLMLLDFRRTLLAVVESDHLAHYTTSATTLNSHMPALVDRLESRMPRPEVTQRQLRDRSWWTGPELYLIVDDYDLVATSAGNPLAPMLEFLPHARDVGLHLIVARRSGGAARAMFEPMLARMRDLGCMGLMMSSNPDEGVLLGTSRPRVLPPGRATLITRSAGERVIQVAWSEP